MTLSEKINKLTWFSEVIKLKDILKDFLTNITSLTASVTELEENPIDSRPYKSYVATLFGDDTEVPTATVLENTLGEEVVITNPSVGVYAFTFDSPDPTKLYVPYTPSIEGHTSSVGTGGTGITVEFYDFANSQATNTSFSNTPIEIRVYN